MADRTYTAKATSGGNTVQTTVFVPAKTVTPPDQVSPVDDLSGSDVGATSLTVGWSWEKGGGLDVTGFEIRYRTPAGTGTWSSVRSAEATEREYTVAGLTANTSYEVEVVAVNAGPPVTKSTAQTVVVRTETPPEKVINTPGGLEAANVQQTTATVTWSWSKGTNLDATGFEVRFRKTGDAWSSPASKVASARSHNLTGLVAGTAYEVEVTAVNAGPPRTSAAAAFQFTTGAIPTTIQSARDLSVTGQTGTALTVGWAWDQGAGVTADSFEVWQRTPIGTGAWVAATPATVAGAARTATLSGLTADTEYEIRVIAVHTTPSTKSNGAITSDRTTAAAGPQVPTNLTIGETGTPGDPSHTVTWAWGTPAAGPTPDYYRLEWGSAWGGQTFGASSTDTAALSFALTNASSGAQYRGRVRAVKGDQLSPWTAWVTFNSAAGTTPGNVYNVVSPDDQSTATSIVAQWYQETTGPVPTKYNVQYRRAGASAWEDVSPDPVFDPEASPKSTTITGLTPGSSYEIRVRAATATATGAWTLSTDGGSTKASGAALRSTKKTNGGSS